MDDLKLKRLENTIREKLSLMIMNGQIKDPRVDTMISITYIKLSKDCAHAKAYISSFQGEKKASRAVIALNKCSGFIQHTLGKTLRTRNTPRIQFIVDTSLEDGFALNQKIDELVKE